MVFQVPQICDTAGAGLQILLYLLILGFYIKNRSIHKKYTVHRTKNGGRQSFNAHVFNTTVQQQVNQAFTNIMDTIATERNGLKSALGLNALSSEDKQICKMQSNSKLPKSYDNHRVSDDRTGRAGRHDKVLKLLAKGLSARKISEGLKIPMGEVELILSLQRK
jgi:hypothetical protein